MRHRKVLPTAPAASPDPLESAIAAQVEWYLGRVNLETDDYLKRHMDQEFWVDIAVILDFPKMMRMGVQDVNRVADALKRSTIVEVDLANARIRPAWARRSTLVMTDIPPTTRIEDIARLLADENGNSAQGLLSVQQAADTTWLAVFDTPTGAQLALPSVVDTVINGSKLRAEAHAENTFLQPSTNTSPRPSAQPSYPRQPQGVYPHPSESQSPAYAPVSPMMVPVQMLPGAAHDVHPQFYPPYVPQYSHHPVGVPRQFMTPRAMPPPQQGYMVYPQPHAYEQVPVASMQTSMQPTPPGQDPAASGPNVQSPQSSAETHHIVPSSPSASTPGASAPSGTDHVPAAPNGVDVASANSQPVTPNDPNRRYAPPHPALVAVSSAVPVTSAIPLSAGVPIGATMALSAPMPTSATMPVSATMSMPIIQAQHMDPSQMIPKGSVDHHYMHRNNMIPDSVSMPVAPQHMNSAHMSGMYNRAGRNHHHGGVHRGDRGMQRGGDGRGSSRGQGNGTDGSGRGPPNRKGRKGNRNNNGRHMHHDRHGEGRSYDSKVDNHSSPGHRDERRSSRDGKPKPEPNLASMNFPPLLPTGDNPASSARPTEANKSVPMQKDASNTVASEDNKAARNPNDSSDKLNGTAGNETEVQSDVNVEPVTPTSTDGKLLSSEVREGVVASIEPVPAVISPSGNNIAQDTQSQRVATVKKAAERPTPAPANGSAMSYAEILRSKKPAMPRGSTQAPRGASHSSSRSGTDSGHGGNAYGGKERNSRRRKGNSRNSSHQDMSKAIESTSGMGNSSESIGSKVGDISNNSAEARDVNTKDPAYRATVAPEASRPNSVWANKPKSLFQAASSTPTNRRVAPVEGRKATAPSPNEVDGMKDNKSGDGQSQGAGSNGDSDSLNGGSHVSANETSMNGAELPDIAQMTIAKGKQPLSGDTHGGMGMKKDSANINGSQVAPKGAWAAGGPRAWPKNNGNGMLERSSSTSDS